MKKGTKTKTTKKEPAPAPKRMKQLGLGEQYEGKKIAAIDEKGDAIVETEEQLARLKRKKYVGADGDTFVVTGDTKTTIKVRREKKAKAKDDE